jgi:hypothetical protein
VPSPPRASGEIVARMEKNEFNFLENLPHNPPLAIFVETLLSLSQGLFLRFAQIMTTTKKKVQQENVFPVFSVNFNI